MEAPTPAVLGPPERFATPSIGSVANIENFMFREAGNGSALGGQAGVCGPWRATRKW
jgi:hypothetical protein